MIVTLTYVELTGTLGRAYARTCSKTPAHKWKDASQHTVPSGWPLTDSELGSAAACVHTTRTLTGADVWG